MLVVVVRDFECSRDVENDPFWLVVVGKKVQSKFKRRISKKNGLFSAVCFDGLILSSYCSRNCCSGPKIVIVVVDD